MTEVWKRPDEFDLADFVQVQKVSYAKGKAGKFWVNALYVEKDSVLGAHVVIYADGMKEVLNSETKIRKAP